MTVVRLQAGRFAPFAPGHLSTPEWLAVPVLLIIQTHPRLGLVLLVIVKVMEGGVAAWPYPRER